MSQPNQKQSLKRATQDYFEQIELTDAELDRLGSMLEQVNEYDTPASVEANAIHEGNEPTGHAKRLKLPSWQFYGFAASILLAVTLVWHQLAPVGSQDVSYLIAKEVAKNHMQLKPLEVSSNNFQKVSNYFYKLDFKPAPSAFLDRNNIRALQGARYCSILSVTAAQIRYKNADGKVVTFYEVGYDMDKFGNMPTISKALDGSSTTPRVHYVNGMKVDIWVEKGLLMASAVDVG